VHLPLAWPTPSTGLADRGAGPAPPRAAGEAVITKGQSYKRRELDGWTPRDQGFAQNRGQGRTAHPIPLNLSVRSGGAACSTLRSSAVSGAVGVIEHVDTAAVSK
jgi:hypothetical protein